MQPTKDSLLKRVENVLNKAAVATQSNDMWANPVAAQAFRSAGLTLLADLYGEGHHHYIEFAATADGSMVAGYRQAQAIISIVREEVQDDLLTSTRALIAASLFTDFLEMAMHLLNEGYKDAAAVIAGSSLEAHLRRLCAGQGIQTDDGKGKPKKADLLNAELHKAGAYELSDQKQVTAWLGIRNDAAHGHYSKVLEGSVQVMIDGIRHFVTTHPA